MTRRFSLLCLTLGGCASILGIEDPVGGGDDDPPTIDARPDGPTIDGGPDTPAIDAPQACEQVDLLFVLDNSGSMQEENANLGVNIPSFMQVLEGIDYRIGVITPGRDLTYQMELPGFPPIPVTEEGEDGVMRGGCGIDRQWIQADDPDPADAFACRAAVGINGSGTEMPLYATKLATWDRVVDGTNAGFLRASAPLVVVIISDEDDCSREDNNFTTAEPCTPAELRDPLGYRDYLDDLKGTRDLWAMAIVAGPGPGPCTSSFGDAQEATRMRYFQDQTGDNVVFASICSGNMGIALDRVLEVADAACAAND